MYNIKTLLAAATMAVAMAAGGAQAAPWDNHPTGNRIADQRIADPRMMDHRATMRHERAFVVKARVFDTLRMHHFRAIADPMFIRGHYVVRSQDRFGHVVFVEVDPYTGAFIGRFRA